MILKLCNPRLLFAVIVISVGSGFQFGYNIGVVNAPAEVLKAFINNVQINRNTNKAGFNPDELTLIWSVVTSIFTVGGMCGGLSTAFVAEKIGRKKGLMFINIFSIIGGILMAVARISQSYEVLIVGRFLVGLNAGLCVGIAPMFLTEIAPLELRGMIGTTFQLIVTVAILISIILGHEKVLGTDKLWPALFALIVIPATVQSFALVFCPESPRHVLWKTRDAEKTKKALSWLRQTGEDIDAELQNIKNEIEAASNRPKQSILRVVTDQTLRKLFGLGMIAMMVQQLSGINAIMFYSTRIFKVANFGWEREATIAVGTINVLTTIVSLWLVERFGRRNLFLSNLIGLAICTAVICVFIVLLEDDEKNDTYPYIVIVLVWLYVIIFASGLGPIPMFIVSELVDQNSRSLVTSCAVFIHWFCNFIVAISFPNLFESIGGYVFLFFTFFLILAFCYMFFKLPETKNKTPEEMAEAVTKGINLMTGMVKQPPEGEGAATT